MSNFKAIIRGNLIKNCPVNHEDIEIMNDIWGLDIPTLKGKTARETPKKVKGDIIKIPKELRMKNYNITLHMDIFKINGAIFLATVGHPIYYRTCVYLKDEERETIYNGLDRTLRGYNSGGFRINKIECDGEFRSMMDDVKDKLDINMNYSNVQDHVPAAERNNRTIK